LAVASQLSLNVCSGAVESAQASFVKTWQQASFVKTWHQLTYPLESEKFAIVHATKLIFLHSCSIRIFDWQFRRDLVTQPNSYSCILAPA